MGCEFFFAREFFSVKMLHRRVCVLDVCFGMSRNSLFSLGYWISPPQVVLMDCQRWAEMVQAWPDMTQRKTLVCNDWPQEWDNQSPPWGLKNGLEDWVGDRDFSLSLPGLKAVIPLHAHRFQCPSLFSHVMKLISKESRPSEMREGTWAPWILPCLQLEFQLAFSLESPWAHKWSLPAFAVKCCGRGSRQSCPLVTSVMSSSLRPCGLQPARLLSTGFSRQGYRRGVLCPPPGGLPDPGMNPGLLHCRQGLHCWATREAPGSCPCQVTSAVSDSAARWTVARQAPLSTGFSRQELWSGLPSLPPEDPA